MPLAVIDTNVVVSGVLSSAPGSPTVRIVDAMLSGRLRFALSETLLIEYRRVLLRPTIVERHGLTGAEVDHFLEGLVVNALMRDPSVTDHGSAPATDLPAAVHGDEHVIALMAAVPEAVLVSGDIRLRESLAARYQVASPAEFAGGLK